MKRWKRVSAVLAAAGAVVAASNGVAAARPPVPVKARTVHPVTAPDVMQPGLVHLQNTGSQPLMLFRKKSAGVATLVRDVNAQDSSTGFERLYRQFHAVAAINAHADAFVRLRSGTYYLFSAETDRVHADDVHAITVQGATDNATAPHAHPVTIQAHTNALSAPHLVHAGRYFHFRNRTHQTEQMVFFPISAKVTSAQLQQFLAAPSLPKLFALVDVMAFVVTLPVVTGGGEDQYLRYPRHTGRYVAVAIPLSGSVPILHRHAAALIRVV